MKNNTVKKDRSAAAHKAWKTRRKNRAAVQTALVAASNPQTYYKVEHFGSDVTITMQYTGALGTPATDKVMILMAQFNHVTTG